MQQCLIRPSTAADVRRMSYIHAASWRVAYRGQIDDDYLDNLADDRWVPMFQLNFDEPEDKARGLVLEINGELVGVTHYHRSRDEDKPQAGEIFSCYLLPDYWGQGLGHVLLMKALDNLRAEGFREAVVWTLDTNARAIKAYERLGFRADGTSKYIQIGSQTVNDVRYIIQL